MPVFLMRLPRARARLGSAGGAACMQLGQVHLACSWASCDRSHVVTCPALATYRAVSLCQLL